MPPTKSRVVEWTDFLNPTGQDLARLKKDLGIHPVIMEELRGPSARTRVEAHPGYLYFTYFFPAYNQTEGTSKRAEIDLVVTKDRVVTVHYEPIAKATGTFAVEPGEGSLLFTYRFLKQLISFEDRQVRHIREKIEEVARQLFSGNERKILKEINYLKRDVSEYRIVVRLQELILKSLVAKGSKFWGGDAEVYLSDLFDEQVKVVSQAEDCREAIADFETTNVQLMNLKTNTVITSLTSLSLLTFPSMVFLALFSTRAGDTPIINSPYGFWIIFGILLMGLVTMATYFKKKHWL